MIERIYCSMKVRFHLIRTPFPVSESKGTDVMSTQSYV